MGFMANLKGQKALTLQGKGRNDEARKLYEEALAQGMNDARMMLAYGVLLIRDGEFQKAKELLVKTQKAPGITPDQKSQLFMNYAVCCFKLGDMERGIDLLAKQHLHHPTGLTYQTLGYLYVEAGDAEKALELNKAAVEYDDEDPIVLDNMGQTYYRVLGDKEEAKKWFDKAIAQKPDQKDTLWFLSRYDLDNGDTAAALEKVEKMLPGRFSPLNYITKEQVEAEIARLKG